MLKPTDRHILDEVEKVKVFIPLDISEDMLLAIFSLDKEVQIAI